MGRNPKSASEITGHHLTETEKKKLAQLEQEIAGASDRLKIGLNGLFTPERKQLRNQNAKDYYHILASEASESSALGNIHISTLIDLANEMSLIKEYEQDIKKYKRVIFVGQKPVPNPAIKMRQDSLKAINAMLKLLGLGAIDIVTLARQKADMGEKEEVDDLINGDIAAEAFGEEENNGIQSK